MRRAAFTALLLAAPALAAEGAPAGLPISGRIFADVYVPTRQVGNNDLQQVSTTLWLEGEPKVGEHGFARFVLQTIAFNARLSEFGTPTTPQTFRTDIREGYAGYAAKGFEFRFGQQIIPWGKSDAVNPTDFLSAKNFSLFNPDEEVRRVGATSLQTVWTPAQGNSPLTFTLVWTPVFPRTILHIPLNAVPSGVTFGGIVNPVPTLPNSELAGRVGYAGVGWDGTLSAYRGWNHVPEFAVSGTTLVQTYFKDRALGADFAATSGNWIFRGESAYIWTENNDGTNPLIQPTHWDSVAGVERPFGDHFRAQAQFLYRYYPNFTDPALATGPTPQAAAINSQIAQANALLLGYQFKSRPGATFRLAYTSEDDGVEAEIFTIGNFVGGDYLLRPKFTYAWSDAFKTTFGTDYHGGPVDRPLGALKAYNSLFVEAKYSF